MMPEAKIKSQNLHFECSGKLPETWAMKPFAAVYLYLVGKDLKFTSSGGNHHVKAQAFVITY
jgi:hypothetical protein